MVVLREQVHPEGASRSQRPLAPLPVATASPDTAGGTRPESASIFANQAYFYAQCEAEDAVGSCVYADSTEAFVSTADERSPEPVVGIIIGKQGDGYCTVQRFGESIVEFEGLVQGKRYFLGPKGSIICPPFTADVPEFVQQVGNATSSTRLFIQPAGRVIRRITSRDFVLNNGPDAPAPNGKYPRVDIYVQKDGPNGPQMYLSPTPDDHDSIILVGDGEPTLTQAANAQVVYRDSDGNLYYADGSGSVGQDISGLIFGAKAPDGTEQPTNNVYYIDDRLEAFARTNVTGTS